MEFSHHHNLSGVNALDVAAITTDTTTVGDIIDTLGYESLEFFIQSGTLTDGTYTVKIEDGDDSGLSDAADVSAELRQNVALPVFALTEDNIVKRIGVITKKRYVRLSLVSASTTTGGTLGAIGVLGHPKHAPVAETP